MMEVRVIQTVKVELKKEAFTEEFMAEFRKHFFQLDTLEEHAAHISQLIARGVYNEVPGLPGTMAIEFFEGYGPIGEFVASAVITDVEIEPVED